MPRQDLAWRERHRGPYLGDRNEMVDDIGAIRGGFRGDDKRANPSADAVEARNEGQQVWRDAVLGPLHPGLVQELLWAHTPMTR